MLLMVIQMVVAILLKLQSYPVLIPVSIGAVVVLIGSFKLAVEEHTPQDRSN